jgi:hypothetical protein
MESRISNDTSEDNRAQEAAAEELLMLAAKDYLALGWPVVPLFGKLAAVPWKEFQTRVPKLAEVERWFFASARKPSGLGIVTGTLSGLVVVDCDSPADADYWRVEHGSSPLMASTGGGGVHLYYAMPPSETVRNRAHIFGRKIDVRGEGGYVTAPPSIHPSGVRYDWSRCDCHATLPVFESAWLAPEKHEKVFPRTPETIRIRRALAYIRRIQAIAGEGGHNATFRAACRLRDTGLSEDEALALLSTWNETNALPPWSAAELTHKIRSAFDALRR